MATDNEFNDLSKMSFSSSSSSVGQSLTRHINCLLDDNRNTRKRAIEAIRKETLSRDPPLEPDTLQRVFSEFTLKPLLKIFYDPVEKCRELSVSTVTDVVQKISQPHEFLQYILPTLVQRLGQQELVEPSEEIRLQLVGLLHSLVVLCGKKISPYVDDVAKILQRTIVDPYPEVKKLSCECACSISKSIPEYFHLQSDSLVTPLLSTITHQHSKVRVVVVQTIGTVLQYGNGKAVDDVISHLAQRLFDQTPAVRLAVIRVVGMWLLDLPDRYSYHHKLMPLLLSGVTDEMPEIRKEAEVLWNDIGFKYASENENDLKDKMDFVKPDPEHYPKHIERPNLGCRTLMYHHFSKILSGLIGDLTDWVAATRIKSSQLLYVLLINDEGNVTQHLEKVLTGLYKASSDEEKVVVEFVMKSAELIGYFVVPEVWCKLVLQNIKLTQSPGSLSILAAIIRGTHRDQLRPFLADIASIISDPGICRVAETNLQLNVLACVAAIIETGNADCQCISFDLFLIILSVIGLHRKDFVKEQAEEFMNLLASIQQLPSRSQLAVNHMKQTLELLDATYQDWTQHSTELFLFEALIIEAGPLLGTFLDDVMKIFLSNLQRTKSHEVRHRFFAMLSHLLTNVSTTLNSDNKFEEVVVSIVREMILPNCIWSAGRTAEVIRKMAVSCLWTLLSEKLLSRNQLLSLAEELVVQLRSCLEDDNKGTRLVTCHVLSQIFRVVGDDLEKDTHLYNMYPDLLKRLDDAGDDVRIAAAETFSAYFGCLRPQYDVGLYRAHLEEIYKGLLIHLDDPNETIQLAILETLQSTASICPDMLLKLVDSVRLKHRSTHFCDKLTQFIHSLPKPQ